MKNGYIQPIDGYLPVKTDFEPIPVIFDFCDYPEVSSYIAAKGKGQLYQQVSRDDDDTYTALTKFIGRQEIVPQVSSYKIEMGLAVRWQATGVICHIAPKVLTLRATGLS